MVGGTTGDYQDAGFEVIIDFHGIYLNGGYSWYGCCIWIILFSMLCISNNITMVRTMKNAQKKIIIIDRLNNSKLWSGNIIDAKNNAGLRKNVMIVSIIETIIIEPSSSIVTIGWIQVLLQDIVFGRKELIWTVKYINIQLLIQCMKMMRFQLSDYL